MIECCGNSNHQHSLILKNIKWRIYQGRWNSNRIEHQGLKEINIKRNAVY